MTSASDRGRLDAKVAIVTGGASGLGLAAAERFASEAAVVLVADRDATNARRVADAIVGGGEARAAEVEITDPDSVDYMVASVIEEFGRVDVLLACAGIPGEGNAMVLSVSDWNRVISINLTGVWLSIRSVLPFMTERGGGSIIAMASLAGLTGVANSPAYSAAKGGVVALARQVAFDFAPRGVRVNSICPGTIRTPLVEEAFRRRNPDDPEAAIAKRAVTVPLGRLGLPADVANVALFLASDESAWITGASYVVDGGISAAMVPHSS